MILKFLQKLHYNLLLTKARPARQMNDRTNGPNKILSCIAS